MKRAWTVFLIAILALVTGASITACETKTTELSACWDLGTANLMDINLAKILLEEIGYELETVGIDNAPAFAGIAAGDLDFHSGCWLPTHDEFINQYPDDIEVLDTVIYEGMSYWAVPRYTSEEYGITKFSDLMRPELVELFDSDGDGLGELSGGAPGWGDTLKNDYNIEQAELPYEQTIAAYGAQLAYIVGQFEKEEDFLYYWWTPQPSVDKYDYVILEDDYGYWPEEDKEPGFSGWPICTIHYAVNVNMSEEYPKAVELLSRIVTGVEAEGKFLVDIEEQELDGTPEGTEELARTWVAENRDTVDEWLDGLQ